MDRKSSCCSRPAWGGIQVITGHHPSDSDSGIFPLGLMGHSSDNCPERKGPSVKPELGGSPDLSSRFCKAMEESQHHPPCGAVMGGWGMKESFGERTLGFPLLVVPLP